MHPLNKVWIIELSWLKIGEKSKNLSWEENKWRFIRIQYSWKIDKLKPYIKQKNLLNVQVFNYIHIYIWSTYYYKYNITANIMN
jgi:hypothetical protein